MERKHYLAMLVDILPVHPGRLHKHEVVRKIRERLIAQRASVPADLDASVRSAYNRHCENYAENVRSGAVALFKSEQKGSGYWSLHPDIEKDVPPLDDL